MKQFVVFITCCLAVCTGLQAQEPLRKKHFNLEKGVAIQGYDPVAYFNSNKGVKGNKANAVVHQGITYYFSTVQNKEAFKTAPSRYEPEYGGWCAYAMGAKGEKVEIDPETFTIINGKLFLFYHAFFNNTLKDWKKDEANLHRKADIHWANIYH